MLSKDIRFGYRCIGTSMLPVDIGADENHTPISDNALICRVASWDGDSFAALVSRQQNEPYLLKSSAHSVNPEAIDTLLLIQYSSTYHNDTEVDTKACGKDVSRNFDKQALYVRVTSEH